MHPIYRADCYFFLSANCHRLWWSIYIFRNTHKCPAKYLPEDSEAKSDQSFDRYCIFLHNQIILLFLKLTTIYWEKKKELNEEIFVFQSSTEGNCNPPVDFLTLFTSFCLHVAGIHILQNRLF